MDVDDPIGAENVAIAFSIGAQVMICGREARVDWRGGRGGREGEEEVHWRWAEVLSAES